MQLISVIIPIGSIDSFTFEAIESILNQSYSNLEILLIINGPNSNEIKDDISKKFQDDRLIYHIINFGGTANAANYGLIKAKSDFVARIDADDLCYPQRLSQQLKFLIQNPEYGVVGSKVVLIDENNRILKDKFFFYEKHKQIKNILPIFVAMCQPALMFRRKCLEEVGGYKFGFMSEDHELLIRIAFTTSWKLYNIPEILTLYRRHSRQVTTTNTIYKSFSEISSMLMMYFLKSFNIKFLFGILYILPPVIWLKKRIRLFIRKL